MQGPLTAAKTKETVMRENILSMPVLITCSALIWALGGLVALYSIGRREQKRTGLGFFDALLEDRKTLPVPMYLGYFFVFITSWTYLIPPLLFKQCVVGISHLVRLISTTLFKKKKGTHA